MEPEINFFEGKRVLITGGGGYLGSKLAERLSTSNATIFLFDVKFNPSSTELSKKNKNIQLLNVDITEKESIEKASLKANPDYIFHFAALLNRERDFSAYPSLFNVNVKGTLNLLEALKHITYKGFCFASTSEVYGAMNPVPFHEKQLPSPVSPYSLSKVMAEQLIKTYSDIHRKPFTILRIFNFYGEGMVESFFINQLITTLKANKQFDMTGGEQVRDFIYIEDLLNTIITLSMGDSCRGEIINICGGKGLKLKEVAAEIARQMGKSHLLNIGALPYRVNEVWEMVGNNSKLYSFGVDLSNTNLHLNLKRII